MACIYVNICFIQSIWNALPAYGGNTETMTIMTLIHQCINSDILITIANEDI